MNKNLLFYSFIALLWIAAGAAVYVTFFDGSPGNRETIPPKHSGTTAANQIAHGNDSSEQSEGAIAANATILDEDGNPIDPDKANEPFELPDFEFINQSGEPFGKKDLLGKPWVATFVFTRCPGPCFQITGKMRVLQKDLKKYDFNLVSFTVDPKEDTPEKLTKYADAYSADLSNWSFLTGDQAEIYTLIQQGFKMPVGEIAEGNIIHVNSFVVVDEKGFVQPDHYDAWESDSEFQELKKKLIELSEKRTEVTP